MNQEIEGKLREILSPAPDVIINARIKAIQELVVSTVPDEKDKSNSNVYNWANKIGFNDCRTEILKKWS